MQRVGICVLRRAIFLHRRPDADTRPVCTNATATTTSSKPTCHTERLHSHNVRIVAHKSR